MTVYKGNKLLDVSTDANGAVGLGNEGLFQSFIVCSEHGTVMDDAGDETVSTKITYGKISAGKLKGLKSKTVTNNYVR